MKSIDNEFHFKKLIFEVE